MSEHLLTSHGYHIISIQNDYFKFNAVFTMAVLNSFQTHCDLQSKHKSHNDWKAFYSECFLQWKLFMIVNYAFKLRSGTVQFSFRHLSQNKTKMNSEANSLHKKGSIAKQTMCLWKEEHNGDCWAIKTDYWNLLQQIQHKCQNMFLILSQKLNWIELFPFVM